MLQKLENIYLGILRAFILLVAGILLVGTVAFGLGALKGLGDGPSYDEYVPEVSSHNAVDSIVEENSGSDESRDDTNLGEQEDTEPSQSNELVDPNGELYSQSAEAIGKFVNEVSEGQQGINQEQVAAYIRERAEWYDSRRLVDSYAEGVLDYLNDVLFSERVVEVASPENVFVIVNQTLDSFDDRFSDLLQEEESRRNMERAQFMQDKAGAMQNLYIAGGAFGAFLIIVFISIFIKIERNLRDIAQGRYEQ